MINHSQTIFPWLTIGHSGSPPSHKPPAWPCHRDPATPGPATHGRWNYRMKPSKLLRQHAPTISYNELWSIMIHSATLTSPEVLWKKPTDWNHHSNLRPRPGHALGSPDVPLMDSTRSPARTGCAPFERLLFHKGTAPSAWCWGKLWFKTGWWP